jgi:putative transposase
VISFFKWLLKALESSGLFTRNRFSLETKLKAVLLYLAILSYRDITYVLGFVPASHEAMRLWVKKIEHFNLNLAPKERRLVAVDETKIKANGVCCFIWAAIDVDSRELLAIYVSWQRSILDSEAFLRKVLSTCTNKPVILADKGPWYPEAFDTFQLEWIHQTFGQRNYIERWFRTTKERTKRFYNNFPAKTSQIQKIKLFLKLFVLYYNFIRPHQTLKHPPATPTT